MIERIYRKTVSWIDDLEYGSNIARGIVVGIDPFGLAELAIRGFSKSWLQENGQFDTEDWVTLGSKQCLRFLGENPPQSFRGVSGLGFAVGIGIGLLLTALTQSVLWAVTLAINIINLFERGVLRRATSTVRRTS